jgi:hypothetical protein
MIATPGMNIMVSHRLSARKARANAHMWAVVVVIGILVVVGVVLGVVFGLSGSASTSSSSSSTSSTSSSSGSSGGGSSSSESTPEEEEEESEYTMTVSDVSGSPVSGVTVEAGGSTLGTTNSSGVLTFSTAASTATITKTNWKEQDVDLSSSDLEVEMQSWSPFSPWATLASARSGDTVTITYSFVPAGAVLMHGTSVDFQDPDETLDHTAALVEARNAVSALIGLLEEAFPCVTFEATEIAEPTGVDVLNSGDVTEGDIGTNVGEIRIGIVPENGFSEGVLGFAYSPTLGTHVASDIFLNADVDWRLDNDVMDGMTDGGHSAKFVVLHELLHAIGLGHDGSVSSVMYPSVSTSRSLGSYDTPEDRVFERVALQQTYPDVCG